MTKNMSSPGRIDQKTCLCCGVVLARKRFPSGRLEDLSAFKKRKYCSLACANTRKDETKAVRKKMVKARQIVDGAQAPVEHENLSPLDFMLKVMRDPNEPDYRRDRMAIAAAKYCHRRASGDVGKKERQAQAAKEAGKGMFKAMQGPKVLKFSREG